MKTIQLLLFSCLILFLAACAVSEEEKAADLQRQRDSVAAAEAMIRSAQLANESRANALNTINQEALKNDSVIRKDSLFKVFKDTSSIVKTDSSKVIKTAITKPKAVIKPAVKKAAPSKVAEKKKVDTAIKNTTQKPNQKK